MQPYILGAMLALVVVALPLAARAPVGRLLYRRRAKAVLRHLCPPRAVRRAA